MQEISMPYAQFCREPKIALKHKICFEKVGESVSYHCDISIKSHSSKRRVIIRIRKC